MPKRLILIPLLMVSLMAAGCDGQRTEAPGTKKPDDGRTEQARKEATDASLSIPKKFELSMVKDLKGVGEEFTVPYRVRLYRGIGDSAAEIGTGHASYKVGEVAYPDSLGAWKPGAGQKILAVTLQAKGDLGNTGQPQFFDQAGADPSPQFFLADKQGARYYALDTGSDSMASILPGGKSLKALELMNAAWNTSAVVFAVSADIQEPMLVIQSLQSDGRYSYVGIKLH